METPTFSNSQEEIAYWKNLAEENLCRANTVQQELDEYTEGSQQLEKELETALDQYEKSNRDLQQQQQRLLNELESLRNKLEQCNRETNFLESEVKALKVDKERQAAYIRELEQKNDDLERAQRVITESVAGIEALLHQSYERNAVLEGEVDEIDTLRTKLQRAMDEARDLRQELLVTKYRNTNGNVEAPVEDERLVINGHATTLVESETQTNLSSTPIKREYVVNGNTLTPSSRVSAMNIIGDLLRKVGLEKFLCPECDKVRCVCPEERETDAAPDVQPGRPPDGPVSLAQLDCRRANTAHANAHARPRPPPLTLRATSQPVPADRPEAPVARRSALPSPGFIRAASARLKDKSMGFLGRASVRKSTDMSQPPRSPSDPKRFNQL